MDVLSDAVTAMRTGKPHSARVRHPVPFGRRFAAVGGAGFHVVLEGTCWLTPESGPPLALGVGDVAFLPRGNAHGLSDSPTTPLSSAPTALPDDEDDLAGTSVLLCGAYLLDRSRTHPLLEDLPDVIHLPARVGTNPELRAAVDLLGVELLRSRPGADAMVPALLEVLLLQILRAHYAESGTGWAAALRDPAVAAALRAIHGDLARAWTVGELAGLAGLSRAAFARRFGALVGRPPLGYLTWWRMTVAAGLLRDGELPLAAIARRVGYASEFAFAHAFKREFGIAPGGYRRAGSRSAHPG
jgi:AraC-like DNA-binding protein